MSIVETVMPEEFRKRLQRAQLCPLCWNLQNKVYVKLSFGPPPAKTSQLTITFGDGRTKIIEAAEKLLGKPLPD